MLVFWVLSVAKGLYGIIQCIPGGLARLRTAKGYCGVPFGTSHHA